jgi:hypothetical protein
MDIPSKLGRGGHKELKKRVSLGATATIPFHYSHNDNSESF